MIQNLENKLALFFYLENYAFGKKDFANIPPSLFRPGTPVDSFGNKKISIVDVDTSQLRTSSYICIGVICSICYGMDPNCHLSYEICSYDPGEEIPGVGAGL